MNYVISEETALKLIEIIKQLESLGTALKTVQAARDDQTGA